MKKIFITILCAAVIMACGCNKEKNEKFKKEKKRNIKKKNYRQQNN